MSARPASEVPKSRPTNQRSTQQGDSQWQSNPWGQTIINVGGLCDCRNVELTARMIEDIPPANLRVPRAEFAAVWAEAERLCDEETRGGPGGGWYAVGVANTCRWIAGASVVFNFPHGPRTQPASAPITGRTARAHEELIEAETLAAERWVSKPNVFDDRPGWLATFRVTRAPKTAWARG